LENFAARIRTVFRKAIKSSNRSRPQLAQLLTARLGRSITVPMLYEFTKNFQPTRIPADVLVALSELTDDKALRELLSKRRRYQLLLGEVGLAAMERAASSKPRK
jgi:hypothetical protein